MTLAILDNIASGMERKWGIDRLPDLMPPAWRAKFDSLKAALDDAITAGTDTTEAAAALVKAWRTMDAKAMEQGSFPLPPACYSVDLRLQGLGIVEIAQDQAHATALIWQARNEGRTVAVWTLSEVGTVLALHGVAHAAKEAWPGAVVTALPAEFRQGKRRMDVADEIPFGGDEVAA